MLTIICVAVAVAVTVLVMSHKAAVETRFKAIEHAMSSGEQWIHDRIRQLEDEAKRRLTELELK